MIFASCRQAKISITCTKTSSIFFNEKHCFIIYNQLSIYFTVLFQLILSTNLPFTIFEMISSQGCE